MANRNHTARLDTCALTRQTWGTVTASVFLKAMASFKRWRSFQGLVTTSLPWHKHVACQCKNLTSMQNTYSTVFGAAHKSGVVPLKPSQLDHMTKPTWERQLGAQHSTSEAQHGSRPGEAQVLGVAPGCICELMVSGSPDCWAIRNPAAHASHRDAEREHLVVPDSHRNDCGGCLTSV
eukprot:s2270_g7.t1